MMDEPGPRHDGVAPLQIDRLSVGYGEGPVVHGVSLSVPPAAVTAILGPNGAGKTTLLRAVAGFLRPASGSVRLFGRDVTGLRPHARFRSGVCLIPEGRGIFRSLTVRENLVVQSPRGDETATTERAVAAFPVLGDRLDQVAGTLSGGEQQMLAVSAAFARDPKLVLVDEVSFGLAPRVVDQIFAFLRDIVAGGASLVIVDQYARRALAMADHAFVLRRGEIAFSGTAEQLSGSALFEQYLGIAAAAMPGGRTRR